MNFLIYKPTACNLYRYKQMGVNKEKLRKEIRKSRKKKQKERGKKEQKEEKDRGT